MPFDLVKQPEYQQVDADHEHRHGLAYSWQRTGKAVNVTGLSGIHAGDNAEFGSRQRCDSMVDVHLATRDEKIFYPADVLANVYPRPKRE